MTKKKNNKLDKDKNDLNKLSQLMREQNDSLRKLLEELSREEKVNAKKSSNTNQFNNSNK